MTTTIDRSDMRTAIVLSDGQRRATVILPAGIREEVFDDISLQLPNGLQLDRTVASLITSLARANSNRRPIDMTFSENPGTRVFNNLSHLNYKLWLLCGCGYSVSKVVRVNH